jgi:hypothetical protein
MATGVIIERMCMVGGEEETKTCASVRIMRMTPIMEIQLNNRDAPFLFAS